MRRIVMIINELIDVKILEAKEQDVSPFLPAIDRLNLELELAFNANNTNGDTP